jgi:methyl-accepting chemotaxis protein
MMILPIIILMMLLFTEIDNNIKVADKMVLGIQYNQELKEFLKYTAQHRGSSNGYLNGDESFKERILNIQKLMDEIVLRIDEIDKEVGGTFQTTEKWTVLKNKWNWLPQNVFTSLNAPDSFALHTELTHETLEFIIYVADQSHLTVVSRLDSNYLMQSIVKDLPLLTETMGQARGFGTGVISKGEATDSDKIRLLSYANTMQANSENIVRAYDTIAKENPSFGKKLKETFNVSQQAVTDLIDTMHNQVINEISIGSTEYFDLATVSMDHSYALYAIEMELLIDQLHQHADALALQRGLIGMVVLIVVFFAIYLCVAFFLSVRGTLNHLIEATSEMAKGDLSIRTEVQSKDEFLSVGIAFNNMAQSFSAMIEKSQETVEQVAGSSVELSAKADETGKTSQNIADSINNIAEGATKQSDHANTILTMLDDTKAQVGIGNQKVKSTLDEAEETTRIANEGNAAISEAISRLGDVTRTVQFATDSIGNLGKRSNEIGGINRVITEISEQTNLLALNAAIEAARAGEQGRGFAVVAEEVRKLAEQSSEAAGRILKLIESIQAETTATVKTMESNLASVQGQVNIIQEGGRSLNKVVMNIEETEKNIHDLTEILKKLENNTEGVFRTVENVTSIIGNTAASSVKVAASAKEQSATVEEISSKSAMLAKLADGLQAEIHRFKVR